MININNSIKIFGDVSYLAAFSTILIGGFGNIFDIIEFQFLINNNYFIGINNQLFNAILHDLNLEIQIY